MPGRISEVGQPAPQRAVELAAPQVEDEGRQALEELDDDVAEDRVADDDVGQVAGQVLALDVALEAQVGRVEQLGRALDPGVALALLLADRQQRHARARRRRARARRRSRPSGRTGRGSPGVESGLAPMSSRTIGPLVGDHLDGERRAVDAGQAAEAQDRGGHPGAGVAGGDDGIGLAAPDQVDRDEDRRVLLLAQGERRVLVHADDLAGGDDRDVGRQVAGDAADDGLVADEDEPVVRVRSGVVEGARARPRTGRGRRPSRRPRRGPRRPPAPRRAGSAARSPRQRAASSPPAGLSWTARRPW